MAKELNPLNVWLIGALIGITISMLVTTDMQYDKIKLLRNQLDNATDHYNSETQRAEWAMDYYRIAYRLLTPSQRERFHENKKKWGYN